MADISKIKLPNGSTYDLRDTGKLAIGTAIMSTNFFAGTGHDSRALYIPKIDNALYCAGKRFNVSITGDYLSFNGIDSLFNGDYEVEYLRMGEDQQVTITFDFTDQWQQKFPGYPYGYVLLSFYDFQFPKSMSVRAYNNYSPQGVGWKNLTVSNPFGNIWWFRNDYYGLQTLEITITGSSSAKRGHTSLSEIDMWLDRPSPYRTPFLSKYVAETLYYPLTAPSFVGSGASLTSLNASNLASGTVPTARLPSASASQAGIMSAADYAKLNGLEADSALTTAEIDALLI